MTARHAATAPQGNLGRGPRHAAPGLPKIRPAASYEPRHRFPVYGTGRARLYPLGCICDPRPADRTHRPPCPWTSPAGGWTA